MYIPDELDQATNHYMDHYAQQDSGSLDWSYGSVANAFQAGAKWATEQLTKPSLTIEDYLEMAHQRFEAANYHSEFRMVEEAIEYMSEEKAIEYLKQVDTP